MRYAVFLARLPFHLSLTCSYLNFRGSTGKLYEPIRAWSFLIHLYAPDKLAEATFHNWRKLRYDTFCQVVTAYLTVRSHAITLEFASGLQ